MGTGGRRSDRHSPGKLSEARIRTFGKWIALWIQVRHAVGVRVLACKKGSFPLSLTQQAPGMQFWDTLSRQGYGRTYWLFRKGPDRKLDIKFPKDFQKLPQVDKSKHSVLRMDCHYSLEDIFASLAVLKTAVSFQTKAAPPFLFSQQIKNLMLNSLKLILKPGNLEILR